MDENFIVEASLDKGARLLIDFNAFQNYTIYCYVIEFLA